MMLGLEPLSTEKVRTQSDQLSLESDVRELDIELVNKGQPDALEFPVDCEREHSVSSGKRILSGYLCKWNLDPIAYFIVGGSFAAVFIALFAFYVFNDRLINQYEQELSYGVNRLDKLVTSRKAVSVESSKETPEPVAAMEIDQAESQVTPPVTVQVLGNRSSPVEVLLGEDTKNNTPSTTNDSLSTNQSPSSHVSELQLMVDRQAEQIDFLAAENHELRLIIEFGSGTLSLNPSRPLTTGLIAEKSPVTSVEPEVGVALGESDDEKISSDNVLPEVQILAERKFTDHGQKIFNDESGHSTGHSTDNLTGNSLLSVDASNTELQQLLSSGYQSYVSGDHDRAVYWYRRAVALDSNNRDANLGFASMAGLTGQPELSIDTYRKMLRMNPDDSEAFAGLLKQSTSKNGVVHELQAHIEKYSVNPSALHAIVGNHYARQLQWIQAKAAFEKSVAHDPSADTLYNLAVSLEHLNKFKEAAHRYQQSLDADGIASFDRNIVLMRLAELSR